MITWEDFVYFICGAALLFSALGLWFIAIMPGIDRWSRHYFRALFGVLMVLCLISLVETYLSAFPVPRSVIYILLTLETLLLSLPHPMLTIYLLHCSGENVRSSKLQHIMLCLWSVFLFLLIIATFSDAFYTITPDKQFFRGPLYPITLLPMALIPLVNLLGTIHRRQRLSRKAYLSFLIALLPMAITVPVHMFVDIYALIDIFTVLSALSMYGLILSDQVEQDMRRQRELTFQRTSVMTLQMRPHFICNTMMSIFYLCKQDPDKTQQVTLDFTDYLRQNFTAIASEDLIPFTDELKHTHAYLAVEQAQYDDRLFVEFDTPHTLFRVPPLTLQPLVENAVKHGMDPNGKPLHIFVGTRLTDDGSEITVGDDGSGFDPVDDDEPHIALGNIRERLRIMCGGELHITPRDGGGTVVTVTIPQKRPNRDSVRESD